MQHQQWATSVSGAAPGIAAGGHERAAAGLDGGGAQREDQVRDAGLAEALLRVRRLQRADQVLPVAQDGNPARVTLTMTLTPMPISSLRLNPLPGTSP